MDCRTRTARPSRRRHRSAVGANQAGLALGSLLAGCLAQFAPDPLRFVYVVYLGLLLPAAFATPRAQETIARPVKRLRDIDLRPRLGVPPDIRAQFVSPAATAFVTFSLLGFSTGLTPSILTNDLHQPGQAVAGAVVFELFLAGAMTIVGTRNLASRTAMFAGLGLLPPTLALLVWAQSAQSMPILLVDTGLAGVATALGYRGSLQVVNEIAPADRRAELVSSYLVACYAGVSLPVIGIGLIAEWAGSFTADLVFAVVIALAAIAAFAIGRRHTQAQT